MKTQLGLKKLKRIFLAGRYTAQMANKLQKHALHHYSMGLEMRSKPTSEQLKRHTFTEMGTESCFQV